MNRARHISTLFVFSLALLAPLSSGCNRQDAELLAKLGSKIGHKIETLAAVSNHRIVHGWQTVPLHLAEVAVDARVAARLNWDKGLAEATLQVQVVDGVVELKGQVRNEQQRRRAVEVAEATVGVEKVADRLEVRASK